jgi:SAM-dependent methyltransferase
VKLHDSLEQLLLEKWENQIPDSWPDANKTERRKYLELYIEDEKYRSEKDPRGYGRANHGADAVEYLRSKRPESVLDVGCGFGNFCDQISEFVPTVYGADIASVKSGNIIDNAKINFIDSDALNISLPDKSVDYVVSFDCLEHCLEDDIEAIIENFARIARKGFIFTIAYRQAGERSNHGEFLHMTVKPESWWISKIEKYANLQGKLLGKYLCFEVKV